MSKNVNKNINGGAAGKAKAAGRMATVAAATIAMTGGSLLSPLTAVRRVRTVPTLLRSRLRCCLR